MVVYIDGVDGSGKTTVCDEFVKKGFEYWHFSKMDDINKTYKEIIDNLVKAKAEGKDVVIDRLFWSNYVYQSIFKDGDFVDESLKIAVNDLIDVVIFSLPSDKEKYLETFEKLKETRHEDYNDMDKVYDSFYNLLNGGDTLKEFHKDQLIWLYDRDSWTLEQIPTFVESCINSYKYLEAKEV